ncbi:hypothetical protein Tco_1231890, partial [Tanacetum coccineum]
YITLPPYHVAAPLLHNITTYEPPPPRWKPTIIDKVFSLCHNESPKKLSSRTPLPSCLECRCRVARNAAAKSPESMWPPPIATLAAGDYCCRHLIKQFKTLKAMADQALYVDQLENLLDNFMLSLNTEIDDDSIEEKAIILSYIGSLYLHAELEGKWPINVDHLFVAVIPISKLTLSMLSPIWFGLCKHKADWILYVTLVPQLDDIEICFTVAKLKWIPSDRHKTP